VPSLPCSRPTLKSRVSNCRKQRFAFTQSQPVPSTIRFGRTLPLDAVAAKPLHTPFSARVPTPQSVWMRVYREPLRRPLRARKSSRGITSARPTARRCLPRRATAANTWRQPRSRTLPPSNWAHCTGPEVRCTETIAGGRIDERTGHPTPVCGTFRPC